MGQKKRQTDAEDLTFDHADVIGAVANGQRDALAMTLDEINYERLLQRRDAAAEDSLTTSGSFQQQQLHLARQRVHLQSPWQPTGYRVDK